MKRLLLILGLLLCASVTRAANPAFVQSDGVFTQATATTATQTDTLTHTSTAGNDLIVGIAWENTTRSMKTLTAAGAIFLPFVGETPGTNSVASVWICHKCAAVSSIVVTLTGGSKFVTAVEEYSNVTSYGQATAAIGTSTHPTTVTTTQDANNIVVMVSGSLGSGGIPTAGTGCGTTSGNLRDANRTGTTATDSAGAFCDQSAASAQTSVSIANTITSVSWSAIAIELRTTTAPMTDHVGSYGTNASQDTNFTQQDFLVPIGPELSLSGNLVVCWANWPGSSTVPTVTTVTGSPDTFTKAVEKDDASNYSVAIWAVIPATSGIRLAKFHFSAALAIGAGFAASCSNFRNATATTDGTCGAVTVTTGPNLSCGSMTTTVTDIILVVASFDGTANGAGPYMGPCREGNGYTLLIPNNIGGNCSEYAVAAAAAQNPGIYFSEWLAGTGGSSQQTNQYNIIGAAFKVSAGGTAPTSMYIAREWQPATAGTAKHYINCPSTGNFMSAASTAGAVFTITDSNQVTWTHNSLSQPGVKLDYSPNSSMDASSMCQYNNTDTSGNDEALTRDVYGVAVTSEIVVPTACPAPSSSINSGSNVGCFNNTSTGSGNPTTDAPDLTPAGSGDLIIIANGAGVGPSTACPQPSGCLYDCPTYTTQSDSTGMCWGEGHAHYYTTSTSALNFGWNANGTVSAGGFEIKSGTIQGHCTITLTGAGPC